MEVGEQIHHLLAVLRVEVTRRFVGEDELGVGDDGAGDGHTLLLAARQLLWEVLGTVFDSHALHDLRDAFLTLGGGDVHVTQRQLDVLIHVEFVDENIKLPLRYMNIPAAERKQRVEAIMARMDIRHRKDHFPQQLSGGQQQRVAIARAVVANPKLILADEPTGNLDSKNGKEVMELLTDLHKEGTTIVMVTHSQRDASYADRIINLFDGKIVEEVLSQL